MLSGDSTAPFRGKFHTIQSSPKIGVYCRETSDIGSSTTYALGPCPGDFTRSLGTVPDGDTILVRGGSGDVRVDGRRVMRIPTPPATAVDDYKPTTTSSGRLLTIASQYFNPSDS